MAIRSLRTWVGAALVALLIVQTGLPLPLVATGNTGPRAVQPRTTTVGPKQYYLALGDSLAYGYQPNGTYNQGYVDSFGSAIGTPASNIVNMACPGETASTFVNGGCNALAPLKYSYTGSQLQAAIAFIKAHPGQVSPVTIDLGIQDLLNDISVTPTSCSIPNSSKLLQDFAALSSSLQSAISQLQTALGSSGDLVVVGYYNPYQNLCANTSAFFGGGQGFAFDSLIDGAGVSVNAAIHTVATNNGAIWVDPYPAFGGAPTQPSNPYPTNPNLCALTWACPPAPVSPYATSAGYAVMAQTIESAVPGYPTGATPTPGGPTATAAPPTTSGPTAIPTATSTPYPKTGAKQYTLVVGDTLSYGYQPDSSVGNNQGYGDYFFNQYVQPAVPAGQPTPQLVNLSCPGETATTFINGGCSDTDGLPLKYPWDTTTTSQLQTAVNFITSHPGQVSPVLVGIGGLDILNDLNPSTCTPNNAATVTQIFQDEITIQSSVGTILSQLRAALTASGQRTGDLAMMPYYNPWAAQCGNVPTGYTTDPYGCSISTFGQLYYCIDSLLTTAAGTNGAPFAHVYSAFGGDNPVLCLNTWECVPPATPISATTPMTTLPNTAGYVTIANNFAAALNYANLPVSPTPIPITPAASATATPLGTSTPTVTGTPPTATNTPTVPTATNTPATPPTVTSTPVSPIYLALGGSATYGYQPNGIYRQGFVDSIAPALGFTANNVVNMSCPGETTTTFIVGQCADLNNAPLKYHYTGSQLSGALSYISAHQAAIKLLTLYLGSGDLFKDINSSCSVTSTLLNNDISTAVNNLQSILTALNGAVGSGTQVVLLNAYNPYTQKCSSNPAVANAITSLNTALQGFVNGTSMKVVDVYTAFSSNANGPCILTWVCSTYGTADPTTGGYQVIAAAVEGAVPPLPTASAVPSATATPTVSNTPTASTTATPADTATMTPIPSSTATLMPGAPTSTATPIPSATATPTGYYLALGDSATYGYQPNGNYNQGYADMLAANLPPGTAYVNLACPGETTAAFLNTPGCAPSSTFNDATQKQPYNTTQLQAALDFINAHPGQITYLTVSLGASDIINDVNPSTCQLSTNAINDGLAAVSNLTTILGQLKTALNGSAKPVLLNAYDPYQQKCATINPQVDLGLQAFDASLSGAKNATVADIYTAFGGTNQNVCLYTWICDATTPTVDPTTQGYFTIAQTVGSLLGLTLSSIPPTVTATPSATSTFPPATPSVTITPGGPTLTPAATATTTDTPRPTNTPTTTATATNSPTPSNTATTSSTPSQTATLAPNAPTSTATPTGYYLALGDSGTYGYQPNGNYNQGYADMLAANLPSGTAYINLACPGETAAAFLNIPGCTPSSTFNNATQKQPYNTTQLQAALSFINAHPGQVKYVSLSLGAADIINDVNPSTCQLSTNAINDGLAAVSNLTTILGQLKTALNGSAKPVLLNAYDPYQQKCATINSQVDLDVQAFDASLSGARNATVADIYAAFGGSSQNVCLYTWICSSPSTIDPTTQGYFAAAQAVGSLLGITVSSIPATVTPVSTATPGGATLTATPTNLPSPTNVPTDMPTLTATPVSTSASGTAAGTGSDNTGSGSYYLALGDAVGYGYQPNGVYTQGFSDDLASLLGYSSGNVVNMACPGETTTTFIKGGCTNLFGAPLKSTYSGSQLQAALAFINANPGAVRLVTVALGASDITSDITATTCQVAPSAVTDGQAALTNIKSILSQLKSALNGSGTVVVLNAYDPYQQKCPGSDIGTVDGDLMLFNSQLVSTVGTLAQIVDVYKAFGGASQQVCTYTWICDKSTPSTDLTTQGYQTVAQAIDTLVGSSASAISGGAPVGTVGVASAATAGAATVAAGGGATSGLGGTELKNKQGLGLTAGAGPCPAGHGTSKTPLIVSVAHRTVHTGAAFVVQARTAARAYLTVTLQVQTTKTVTQRGKDGHLHRTTHTITVYSKTLHAVADKKGLATLHLSIAYRISRSTAATLTVRAAVGCSTIARASAVTILPALAPRLLTLSISAIDAAIVNGHTLTVAIVSAPHAHLQVLLVMRRGFETDSTTVNAVANANGHATAHIRVGYPFGTPTTATLSINARVGSSMATLTTPLTIVPAPAPHPAAHVKGKAVPAHTAAGKGKTTTKR